MGVYCTHQVLCFLSAFGLPELDLLKLSIQPLFWIRNQTNQCPTLFVISSRVANLRAWFYYGIFSFSLKASYQCSHWFPVLFGLPICPCILILFTNFLVFIYVRIKILMIAFKKEFFFLVDGSVFWDPSGLAKNRTPQKWDTS